MINFSVSSEVRQGVFCIATHASDFTSSECMACAILLRVKEKGGLTALHIVRTADPEVFAQADIRVGVGGRHSEEDNTYDHHQKGGAGFRWVTGVLASTAGIVWQAFGDKLVSTREAHFRVDTWLMASIDHSARNGIPQEGITFSFDEFIESMNPSWPMDSSEDNVNTAFKNAVKACVLALDAAIARAYSQDKAEAIVKAADRNGPILVLPQFCPWQRPVFALNKTHTQFCVFQDQSGDWRVQAVPTEPGKWELRHPLPEAWAGLGREQLAAATGVADATFCHKRRFIAGAGSKEGAIALAKLALG